MNDPEDNDDFAECDNCGGEFYKGDLVNGDYCADCHEELFGDDA